MSIGIWQLVLILFIVFVIFGAGKLPRVMGDVGKGVKNLKDGLKEGDKGEKIDSASNAKDITASAEEVPSKKEESSKS